MRLLIILFLLPMLSAGQQPERPDDSLRKIADTMQFPKPFEFKMDFPTGLSAPILYEKCSKWVAGISDSLHGIMVTKDPLNRKITAANVPATADISFTIVIRITGNRYSCSLQQYIYHSVNSISMPVEKAAKAKDYKKDANIERVLIMRNYPFIFGSLNDYIKKPI